MLSNADWLCRRAEAAICDAIALCRESEQVINLLARTKTASQLGRATRSSAQSHTLKNGPFTSIFKK
jgi:hypothetical protein